MIYIDEKLCKGCDICIFICPVNVFESSNKLNEKGYILPIVAREDKCIKCRLCEMICPDFAIHILDDDGGEK